MNTIWSVVPPIMFITYYRHVGLCTNFSVSSLIETISNMGFVKLEIEEACAFSKMDTVL